MRKRLRALVAVAVVLGSAAPARAASLAFTGSLGIQVASLDPIAVTGSGSASANGSGGGSHANALEVAGGVFGVAGVVVPITDPSAAPIAGVQATVSASGGQFSGTPLSGPLQLLGVAKVCLFVACTDSPPVNVSVPLSVVGVGGSESVSLFVQLTVTGNPWTTGVAAIGDDRVFGFAHGPASATSSTAAPSGAVRLVTPILVSTSLAASPLVPTFGILTLHFVPEPGALLLLGSGTAGLAALGRGRGRRH